MRHARLQTLRLHFSLTEQEWRPVGYEQARLCSWETPERSTRGACLPPSIRPSRGLTPITAGRPKGVPPTHRSNRVFRREIG